MRTQYLKLFKDIANDVDKAVSSIFGTDKAKEKFSEGAFGDVTVYVDKVAEDIILSRITNSNLKCSVLSEEIGWIEFENKLPIIIVDPIDGSLNAKRGLPYFSISIALSEGFTTDDIAVGYVKNLSNGDEFYAIKDFGAFFNGKKIIAKSQALNIAAVEGFKKMSDPELIKFIYGNFNKVRQMGSTALDICYLAAGAFDVFFNVVPSRIIDYAASKVILEESGGCVYNWVSSKPFSADISKEKGGLFFCLSNKALLNEILSIMAKII